MSEIKRDKEHCWRCGRKFGEEITFVAGPIATVVGKVERCDEDAILCDDCVDELECLELEANGGER